MYKSEAERDLREEYERNEMESNRRCCGLESTEMQRPA